MTEETELVKAARKAVGIWEEEDGPEYEGRPDQFYHELREAMAELQSILPPKPVTHRCIRPGCDGVPEFEKCIDSDAPPDLDVFVIHCRTCHIRTSDLYIREGKDTQTAAWQTWYNNDTGLPDD